MVFVDTNVVLYAVSRAPEDGEKLEIAAGIMRRQDACFSTQVLSEFFVQATRPGSGPAMTKRLAYEFVRSMTMRTVFPITPEVVFGGIEVSDRYRISYWDGLILSAARRAGCSVVYSEDLNDGQEYEGVRVVNPFLPKAP